MVQSQPILKISNLNAYYNEIQVLFDISLEVYPGEIVALVGANAAGKSTLLKAISGLVKYDGEILFQQENLRGVKPNKIVDKGIIHVPEGRGMFPFMTVLENLELGAYPKKARAEMKETLQKVFEILPRLEERKDQFAGTLSGGEQQMCAIARGLMGLPNLLFLDEPSLGLAPLIIKDCYQAVQEINRKQGTPILLVEQNVQLALKTADRIYVIENGRIVLEGKGEELVNDDRLRQAYMGI
jgi:branched-chain amino acid transport system ATP-binding protein